MSKALVIRDVDFSDNAIKQIEFDLIHCTGISLNKYTLTFTQIGATDALVPTLTPADCEEEIRWTSSNTNVATVNNLGVVSAVGCGSCNIVAQCGSQSAVCIVTSTIALTGYGKYPRMKLYAPNSDNHLTTADSMYTTTSTEYDKFMSCCLASASDNDLFVAQGMLKEDTANDTWYLPPADSSAYGTGASKRVLTQLGGRPIVIPLPNNTTQIKCTALDEHYAPYVLFYKKDVRAASSPSPATTTNKGYFLSYRALSQNISDVTFVYQQETTLDVPDGYDSIIVVWVADVNNGAKNFAQMTSEEIASFTIECM